ncbi:hypothetical protein BVRB_8g182740 [Beta vulgaris subsp. vulgaris]|nr:hypothetical protein BVRB_8g182740 [Beta vulgaris subsp. vulgaris]
MLVEGPTSHLNCLGFIHKLVELKQAYQIFRNSTSGLY